MVPDVFGSVLCPSRGLVVGMNGWIWQDCNETWLTVRKCMRAHDLELGYWELCGG